MGEVEAEPITEAALEPELNQRGLRYRSRPRRPDAINKRTAAGLLRDLPQISGVLFPLRVSKIVLSS